MHATHDTGPEGCIPPHERHGLDRLALEVARVWYAGRSPVAPGTVGSAVAALLAPWLFLPLPLGWRVVVLLAVFFGGAWAAGRAARVLGRCDPGSVVIDEVAGQWMTMLPFATLSPLGVLAAFVLFRVFDILKPGPVGASESWLEGGPGIMIDDMVAGACAAAVLAVLLWLGLPG
ncbi:phosphatidylglycerophosphatase A [Nitratidesulfovibrio sp. SRB-5]|uniref:phosphatidylglycerophosphatase A family protein n=1 Tax=Nitratidesulfovibrio sp. SRB-5 TaxID=2872636 RepID=UPI001025F309|nr:phosphatidylglycerophosphatase A [Nitratidesulfovibrio sp. SRB-5]MBZ2170762.1 phosphatidylglycerophosphatase A [Nitratidesulfovibrio sp. SRB-5]RXF76840.1 phosphatidylglycerophosphatase A [Desulfovibrio sp. DS-1]